MKEENKDLSTLPDTYVMEHIYQGEKEKIEQAEKTVDSSLRFLTEKEIPVNDISSLSVDWLRKFIDNARSAYIGGIKNYTPRATRERIHKDYEDVYNSCNGVVSTIHNVLKNFPFKFSYKDRVFTFNKEDVEEYLSKKSTVTITDEQKEAYKAYKSLSDCLEKVNQWEKDNGWYEFSVKGLHFGNEYGSIHKDIKDLCSDGLTPDKFLSFMRCGYVGRKERFRRIEGEDISPYEEDDED